MSESLASVLETAPRRRGEAGYNLVVLVMAIAILNIMVAAMLPLWSTQIRRVKEDELIFRGLQYAEAIRVFNKRVGRPPSTLQELLEVNPRCIRQLWKDPMVEDGKWAVIHQGDLSPVQTPGSTPTGRAPTTATPVPSEEPGTVSVGPIVGVRSRSTREAIEVWNGQTHYNEWSFTIYALARGAGPPNQPPPNQPPLNGIPQQVGAPGARLPPGAAGAAGTGRLDLSARWVGRPLPGSTSTGIQPIGAGPVTGAPGVGGPAKPTKPTQ